MLEKLKNYYNKYFIKRTYLFCLILYRLTSYPYIALDFFYEYANFIILKTRLFNILRIIHLI